MSENTSTNTPAAPPERWAIVEIMGHRVIAGRLAWGEVPYDKGVAVDVPLPPAPGEVGGVPRFLQEFYGAGSIFSVRIVPEAAARQEAEGSYHVKGIARALLSAPARAAADREEREAAQFIGRPAERADLYREIDALLAERDDEADDQLSVTGWVADIERGTEHAERLHEQGGHTEQGAAEFRQQLVDVAARVIAAIEAHDRAQVDSELADVDLNKEPEDNGPDDEPHGGPGNEESPW